MAQLPIVLKCIIGEYLAGTCAVVTECSMVAHHYCGSDGHERDHIRHECDHIKLYEISTDLKACLNIYPVWGMTCAAYVGARRALAERSGSAAMLDSAVFDILASAASGGRLDIVRDLQISQLAGDRTRGSNSGDLSAAVS